MKAMRLKRRKTIEMKRKGKKRYKSRGKEQNSPNEMLSILLAASAASKKKGLQFTPEEMEQIITVVRMGKSPAEQARIERMMQMIQMMNQKR